LGKLAETPAFFLEAMALFLKALQLREHRTDLQPRRAYG
jgi:hypothetical protein